MPLCVPATSNVSLLLTKPTAGNQSSVSSRVPGITCVGSMPFKHRFLGFPPVLLTKETSITFLQETEDDGKSEDQHHIEERRSHKSFDSHVVGRV